MKLTRLTFLSSSAAGVVTVVVGLFTGITALFLIGLVVSPLALTGAFLARGKCASCKTLLTEVNGKNLCAACEHTLLVTHLPRLSTQIKARQHTA